MVWPPPWPGGGDAGVSSSGGAPPNKFCRVGARATRVAGRSAMALAASTASASRAMLCSAAVLSLQRQAEGSAICALCTATNSETFAWALDGLSLPSRALRSCNAKQLGEQGKAS